MDCPEREDAGHQKEEAEVLKPAIGTLSGRECLKWQRWCC